MGSGNQDFVLREMLTALPRDERRFRDLAARVVDWSALLQNAAQHGLHDLIFSAAARAVELPLPIVKGAVRHQAAEQLIHQQLVNALAESLDALAAARVPVVPLKGPILARRLYPAGVLRPSTDLDLLVSARDVYRAAGILEQLGYRAAGGPFERYYREHHHHLHLQRPNGPLLELHFQAISGFGVEVGADDFFDNAIPYQEPQIPPALILAPEDEFVYLSAHVATHLYLRLAWLYDLKLFALKHRNLDWNEVERRARALGLHGAIIWTVDEARGLGADIPASVFPKPRTLGRWPSWLLTVAQRGSPDSASTHLARILFLATLCDRGNATSFLHHNLLRGARKLAHRHIPHVVPDEWAA